MNKKIIVFIHDIINSIEKIEKYTANVTEESFYNNEEKQDSVIRRFEIIGEAANRIPRVFQDQNEHIPWQDIIGMRNVLIHEYEEVDSNIVWRTIQNQLPETKKQMQELLETFQ